MLKIAIKMEDIFKLQIRNLLKNYLTAATSTICRLERSAFVVFLEKFKVRIPQIKCLEALEKNKQMKTGQKFEP